MKIGKKSKFKIKTCLWHTKAVFLATYLGKIDKCQQGYVPQLVKTENNILRPVAFRNNKLAKCFFSRNPTSSLAIALPLGSLLKYDKYLPDDGQIVFFSDESDISRFIEEETFIPISELKSVIGK